VDGDIVKAYFEPDEWNDAIKDLINYPFDDSVSETDRARFRMQEYNKMSIGRILEYNKMSKQRGLPEMEMPEFLKKYI
jgi:hypothetical protein